jgi:hypothetical protein
LWSQKFGNFPPKGENFFWPNSNKKQILLKILLKYWKFEFVICERQSLCRRTIVYYCFVALTSIVEHDQFQHINPKLFFWVKFLKNYLLLVSKLL